MKDLLYAWRKIVHNPGVAAAAVLSLALGIGANSTIFGFVNALLLRPLPLREPERLVQLYSVDRDNPGFLPLSRLNFDDFRRENKVFSGMAAARPVQVSLTGGREPERVRGELVSASYLDLLGVKPALGRLFLPEEERPGSAPSVVLSHALWQRRFGGDPAIVGSAVLLNGKSFEVVGVTPKEFRGLSVLVAPELWVPMSTYRQVLPAAILAWYDTRQNLIFNAVARLRPGVSLRQASAAMTGLAGSLEQAFPDDNKGLGVLLLPAAQAAIHPTMRDKYVKSAELLMGVVLLLLAIACFNVANLLLTRALAREGEVAVRLAIGADRSRLSRQLLTEGLLLSLLGGAAGLLVAFVSSRLLWAVRSPFMTDALEPSLDLRVLGFTLAISLLTGTVFGLIPVVQTFKANLSLLLRSRANSAQRKGGRGPKVTELLVMGQVALSLIALFGAGLFLASLRKAQSMDPGFETRKLMTVSFDPGAQGYDKPRARQILDQALERVGALPGVESAALAERGLLERGGLRRSLAVVGGAAPDETKNLMVGINSVSPAYFRTLGMRLAKGRELTAADREGSRPVAVINETLARMYWPGGEALGRQFRFSTEPDGSPIEVVGVAVDADYNDLDEERQPYLFLPLAQREQLAVTLLIRTSMAPSSLLPQVRKTMHEVDPNLPLVGMAPVSDLIAKALWAPRMGAALLTLFGVLALVLSAVGIYGVTAYTVGMRRREMGIRIALGATGRSIVTLVVRRGTLLLLGGLALGGLAAALLAPRMSGLLFGVSALDPWSFSLSVLVLAAVALLANYIPARRAAFVPPRESLGSE